MTEFIKDTKGRLLICNDCGEPFRKPFIPEISEDYRLTAICTGCGKKRVSVELCLT